MSRHYGYLQGLEYKSGRQLQNWEDEPVLICVVPLIAMCSRIQFLIDGLKDILDFGCLDIKIVEIRVSFQTGTDALK